jgi:hypothetical protein
MSDHYDDALRSDAYDMQCAARSCGAALMLFVATVVLLAVVTALLWPVVQAVVMAVGG